MIRARRCTVDRVPAASAAGAKSMHAAFVGLVRAALLLAVLPLASCRFLEDEFTRLDRAGPIAEPQQQPPTPTTDRS